jgi:hypothetical protein
LDLTRPAVSHAFVSSRHVLASATLQLNELIRQKVREQGQTLQVAMEVPYLLAIPGIVAGSDYLPTRRPPQASTPTRQAGKLAKKYHHPVALDLLLQYKLSMMTFPAVQVVARYFPLAHRCRDGGGVHPIALSPMTAFRFRGMDALIQAPSLTQITPC